MEQRLGRVWGQGLRFSHLHVHGSLHAQVGKSLVLASLNPISPKQHVDVSPHTKHRRGTGQSLVQGLGFRFLEFVAWDSGLPSSGFEVLRGRAFK